MALRDRLKKRLPEIATATVATIATDESKKNYPVEVETETSATGATGDQGVFIPTPCQSCKQLEVIEIMNEIAPGCLYMAQGEFPDGWRRLPRSLTRCIWNHRRQISTDIDQEV